MPAARASIAVAALLACSAVHAADRMSGDEYNARKDLLEAQYRVDRTACARLAGNAADVCIEEAKGRLKVARAELDHARAGDGSRRAEVAAVRAGAAYAVATERCDDLAGAARDTCMRDAKAAERQARSEVLAEQRYEASYRATRERCDALAGEAKDDCIDAAKALFDKP